MSERREKAEVFGLVEREPLIKVPEGQELLLAGRFCTYGTQWGPIDMYTQDTKWDIV